MYHFNVLSLVNICKKCIKMIPMGVLNHSGIL